MARRAPGALLPIELDLLVSGLELHRAGQQEFHGYSVAATLADAVGAKRLTAHGTLYKALGRLAAGGLLESRWEDASVAEHEGRPRRRLYLVTGAGALAAAEARPAAAGARKSPRGRRDSAARPGPDVSPA